MTDAQKSVISNIFRDLTKLTVVALVLGQFVPGQAFNPVVFFGGLGTAVLMAVAAIVFAVNEKREAV